jgi:hypothetical protein
MKRYPLIAIAMIATLAACSTPNSSVPQDAKPAEAVEAPAAPFKDPVLAEVAKMTPEQIEALSPEKLADIEKRVDADVAKIEAELPALEKGSGNLSAQSAADCGSYTPPAWPNAALTRKCALAIDYNTYVKKVRFSYFGPDWSSDGCSTVPDYVFLDVCRHHDFAYRNLPKYGQFRNATLRKLADDKFYFNMIARCKERYSWWDPRRTYCKAVASSYYGGVRVGGISAYYGTRQLYP